MFKNYLKIAIRNLIKHKGYSFINIAGLTIGLSSFIFLLLWVQDELSFDSFHKNKADIYRVVGDWNKYQWDGFEGTSSPLAEAIKAEVPEVVNAARITNRLRAVFKLGEKVFYEEEGALVDPSLFEIFTFPFLVVDPKSAFSNLNDIVLSEELSKKYFGSDNAVGKTIEVNGIPSTITGIFQNLPHNSHLRFSKPVRFRLSAILASDRQDGTRSTL